MRHFRFNFVRFGVIYRYAQKSVHVCYGVVALTLLGLTLTASWKNEEEITCLARNIYWEGRTEPAHAKRAIGLITLARVLDPRWPGRICDVVFENNQFSWTRNAELVREHNPQDSENWEESLRIAKTLYNRSSPLVLPPRWACVRFYKRTDNADVSANALNWFQRNLKRVGAFGSHSAYAPKKGCEHPLPTT